MLRPGPSSFSHPAPSPKDRQAGLDGQLQAMAQEAVSHVQRPQTPLGSTPSPASKQATSLGHSISACCLLSQGETMPDIQSGATMGLRGVLGQLTTASVERKEQKVLSSGVSGTHQN